MNRRKLDVPIDNDVEIIYLAGMARRTINEEQTVARFPAGTLERIGAVLREGEPRAAFIRDAVEDALVKREDGRRAAVDKGRRATSRQEDGE